MFDRVLTIDPHNARVLAILDGINRRKRRRANLLAGATATVLAACAWMVHRNAQPPPAATLPAIDVPGAPPTPGHSTAVTHDELPAILPAAPADAAPPPADAAIALAAPDAAPGPVAAPVLPDAAVAAGIATQIRVSPAKDSEYAIGRGLRKPVPDDGVIRIDLASEVEVHVFNVTKCCQEESQVVRPGADVTIVMPYLPGRVLPRCAENAHAEVRIGGVASDLGLVFSVPIGDSTDETKTVAVEFLGEHVESHADQGHGRGGQDARGTMPAGTVSARPRRVPAWMRWWIAAAIAAAAAGRAAASPNQDLDHARQSFREHDYDSARKLATFLLYPDEKLAQPVDLVEAHVILGASDFETGHRAEAKLEFEKALQMQPEKVLTDMLFSEGAIRLFDETRADIEARTRRDAELRKIADERERIRKYRDSLVVVERRSFGVNFLPFGAGQFQNKQPTRGLLFAAGEGLTGGISIGIFFYLAGKYGLINAPVPAVETAGVRQLEQIEIGAGIAFFAIYAWGVVDSLLHYKPRVQIEGDDTLLPPLPDAPDARKPRPGKTSILDRVHLAPIVAPRSAGIGLIWESN